MSRPINIRDVAIHCGLAISTVSRVINNKGLVSPETQAKVEEAIKQLGFVPSREAQAMRYRSSETLAPSSQIIELITEEWRLRHSGYSRILMELGAQTSASGYRLALKISKDVEVSRDASGGISLNSQTYTGASHLVSLNYFENTPKRPGVLPDYERGIYRALTAALERGYQKPLIVLPAKTDHDGQNFSSLLYLGASRALRENGLNPEEHFSELHLTSLHSGYEAGLLILKQNPPDLIVTNDDAAIGLYRAAKELGLRIPEDLGIIGCDASECGPYLFPPLATLQIDYATLAREALARLLAMMRKEALPSPLKYLIEVKFLDGDSIRGKTPASMP